MPKIITQDEVISRANSIHNSKYDYSHLKFLRTKDKVEIICPIHGSFKQRLDAHLAGQGCRTCENERRSSKYFIEKSVEVHGNKYNYSLVEYKNAKTKILIKCPEHGIFEQTPNNHLNGQGCPKCSIKKRSLDTKSFIEKSQAIHGGKYDYSISEYSGSKSSITIICPEHGEFEQIAESHLNGANCPHCNLVNSYVNGGWSKTSFQNRCRDKDGIFYVIRCYNDTESFFKIGITSQSVKERYHDKRKMPYSYELISEIHGSPSDIWEMEICTKRELKSFHYVPKIQFAGSMSECFMIQPVNTTNGLK